jgi:hypothetical protein
VARLTVPGELNPPQFTGEKRYWLHIAIDRFDGLCKGTFLTEESEDNKGSEPFAPFAAFCKR